MGCRARRRRHAGLAAATVTALALAGCAGRAERQQAADGLAAAGGLTPVRIAAGTFELAAWRRPGPAEAIVVYIEGDGHAWAGRSRPSPDPTPQRPMAPALAALHPGGGVAALARPCQYRTPTPQPRCDDPSWWTGARFAPPVIDATDRAVEALKREAGARSVHLVGFSGGAAVAILVAARRGDVASLRTVAGNLDPAFVNRLHDVDPLRDGPSPIDVAARLAGVPQVHFVGASDPVVPRSVATRFQAAAGNPPCIRIVEVDAGHHEGWTGHWPALLAIEPSCG